MALSLDGSGRDAATATSVAPVVTTANANDVIVVMVYPNGGPVVSVTSSPSLSFVKRANIGTDPFASEEWWSSCPTPNTYTITVTQTSNAFLVADAFAVSGASNISAPFDGAVVTGVLGPLSITTINPHTFIFGIDRDVASGPSSGAGWTQIQGGSVNCCSEYQIASTIQTGLSVTFIGTTIQNAIADAITSDSPITLMGAICM